MLKYVWENLNKAVESPWYYVPQISTVMAFGSLAFYEDFGNEVFTAITAFTLINLFIGSMRAAAGTIVGLAASQGLAILDVPIFNEASEVYRQAVEATLSVS